MSKLEKREQKNLETALFKAKERVIELEELVLHQSFVVHSAVVEGYLRALSDLCGEFQKYESGWSHPLFEFGRIPRHKKVKDFTDNSVYQTLTIKFRNSSPDIIYTWVLQRIMYFLPNLLVIKDHLTTNWNWNTYRSEHSEEIFQILAYGISDQITGCLQDLAKSSLGYQETWSIYEELVYPRALIFDLPNSEDRIQCALYMYEPFAE